MATADELLGRSTGSVEKVCIIDLDTRQINIPKSITALGVESDDNIKHLYFRMPKTYQGTDLSDGFSIRINYINANNDPAYFAPAKGVTVDNANDTITFYWDVERDVVAYKGSVKFIVCLRKASDVDSTIVAQELNTTVATLPVLEGLETDMESIQVEPTDYLTQLLSVKDEYVSDIIDMGRTYLEDMDDKYHELEEDLHDTATALAKTVGEPYRSRANAIVNTTEGTLISVNDASDDYLRGLRVFGKSTQVTTTGKNLVNLPRHIAKPTSAYNYDLFTGTSGQSTPVPSEKLDLLPYLQPGEYYFNVIVPDEQVSAGTKVLTIADDGTVGNLLLNECGSFTLTAPTRVTIRIGSNAAFSVDDVQIETGDEYTGYEPYSGGYVSPSPDWGQPIESIKNPVVDVHNKNLWNHEYDTVDLSSCTGWGNSIWNNNAVIRTLRPNTTYTLSFEVTALNIPEHETMFADNCGFTLFSSKASGAYIVMAQDIGGGAFKVGEKRTVRSTFTTPDNLLADGMGYGILRYTQRFIKSDGTADYATVRFDNIQLEIGNNTTEYMDANPQELSIPHTLPGIPVDSGGNYTDDVGQQWICDEIDFERGVYVQRMKTVILDGSNDEAWMLYDNNAQQGLSFVYYPSTTGATLYQSSICDKYRNVNGCWGEPYYGQMGIYSDHTGVTGKYFRPPNTAVNSLETWKLWLAENPLTLMYTLKTPIETPLTDTKLLAAYSALHSNYPTTTVMNDQGAHMELKYNADTKTVFESVRSKPPTKEPTVGDVGIKGVRFVLGYDDDYLVRVVKATHSPSEVYEWLVSGSPVIACITHPIDEYSNLSDIYTLLVSFASDSGQVTCWDIYGNYSDDERTDWEYNN